MVSSYQNKQISVDYFFKTLEVVISFLAGGPGVRLVFFFNSETILVFLFSFFWHNHTVLHWFVSMPVAKTIFYVTKHNLIAFRLALYITPYVTVLILFWSRTVLYIISFYSAVKHSKVKSVSVSKNSVMFVAVKLIGTSWNMKVDFLHSLSEDIQGSCCVTQRSNKKTEYQAHMSKFLAPPLKYKHLSGPNQREVSRPQLSHGRMENVK